MKKNSSMLQFRGSPLWFSLLASGVAVASGGCSSSDGEAPPSPSTEYLGLRTPADGAGFQLRTTGVDVGPGEDLEYCEVLELPGGSGETYYVGAVELANGEGSHHLVLEAVRPGGTAEAKVAEVPLAEPFDCVGGAQTFGDGDGFENVAVSQQPYFREDLPSGIGRVLHGGQRVVFDYHYYNTSDETVHARSAANFHLVAAEDVQHVARVFSFNNTMIDVPPLSKKAFVGECKFDDDVVLSSLMRHTHQWGRDFTVWYAGGPNAGQEIFRTPDYEHGINHSFDAPISVNKGDGFRFECAFDNTENRPLRFGLNATDEMCMLFGVWWGAKDTTPPPQDCVMTAFDASGVARPPDEIKFRPPTAPENAACVAISESAPRPLTDACAKCYCDSCAVPINECAADPECKAIMDCAIETRCGYDTCLAACPDAFNAHSAGTGLIVSVGQCLLETCAECTE